VQQGRERGESPLVVMLHGCKLIAEITRQIMPDVAST
jgi:poly(3-hydroxybutyrate) depolymerase